MIEDRDDGTTELYEICEACANASMVRAARAREKARVMAGTSDWDLIRELGNTY